MSGGICVESITMPINDEHNVPVLLDLPACGEVQISARHVFLTIHGMRLLGKESEALGSARIDSNEVHAGDGGASPVIRDSHAIGEVCSQTIMS